MTSKRPAASYFPAVKTPALPGNTFKGRRAFITGGGTGLGKGMATMFASLGAQVVIASRKLERLEQTANEISSSTGNRVHAVAMNVRNPEDVTRAADEFEKLTGGLPNIVVNNAAANFISPTERLSPNAFRTIVDTVLMGSVYVTLEFAKRMLRAEQGGTFLSITTPYARTGSPFVVPSATSKAGVETMTKSLAAEWGRKGLRFNAIAPGPIQTEGAFSRLDPTGQFAGRVKDSVPVGRGGEVEELVNLACYVCSDYANYMNGTIMDFDGGQTVQMGGLFSRLSEVTGEQWDQLEALIRSSNAKEKKSKL